MGQLHLTSHCSAGVNAWGFTKYGGTPAPFVLFYSIFVLFLFFALIPSAVRTFQPLGFRGSFFVLIGFKTKASPFAIFLHIAEQSLRLGRVTGVLWSRCVCRRK
jgi:hypothetical protein